MSRRRLLLAAGIGLLPLRPRAQADWQRVAVPVYTPADWAGGLLHEHLQPRAEAFAAAAKGMVDAAQAALDAGAPDLPRLRQAWLTLLQAWAVLSAVPVGPLIARRTARRIDFQPLRPELAQRALARQPQGAAGFETIGSAAKGLPALEWLLWRREGLADTAARSHLLELARDVSREAEALQQAVTEQAGRELDDEQAVALMNEAVNQWLGALEQMRLHALLRPVQEARTRGQAQPLLPRAASGAAAAERAARWAALQAMALWQQGAAAQPGGRQAVPLESYLRGRGLNPLADRLRRQVLATGQALQAAAGNQPARLQAAAAAMGTLRHLAEAELAPALDVRVGFSDADGD